MKERIIGAAILVSFVVLVVPIFLDGPPESSETVSQRVQLPGQDAQKTQTVILERNRTEPVPAPSNAEQTGVTMPAASAPKKAVDAAPAGAKKAEEPPPVVTGTPAQTAPSTDTPKADTGKAVVSETGMWAVQLGSFSRKENAEKLAADLRKQGYVAFLSQLTTDGGQLHRVRVGPQKNRDAAEAMAARLLKAGHKGQVVPHP